MTGDQEPILGAVAAAGSKRYVPQPPSMNLEDFGGGKKERLSNAGKDAELIPDMASVLSKEELLNSDSMMKLYNDGLTAELFIKTDVGRKLIRYAQADQEAYLTMALDKGDQDDPAVKVAFKRACAANYFRAWLKETLDLADMAETQLRMADEEDNEEG